MIETLFQVAIANAIVAGLLAVIVAIVARLYRNPPVVHALWLLVLIKLVTPPLFEVPLPNIFHTSQTPPLELIAHAPQPITNSAATRFLPISTTGHLARARVTGDAVPIPARPVLLDWIQLVMLVWCAGAFVYFVVSLQRIRRFRRLLRMTAPASPEFSEVARLLSRQLGLKRRPLLRITEGSTSPLAWCAAPSAAPVILFPERLLSELSSDQQAALLAHELAHVRRGDHWVRWFELLVTALYWWHPGVWWARRELHRAGDQCCDAWVLWAFPRRARHYAEALLKTIDFLAEARPNVPPLASTIGQAHFLERRIQMILRHVSTKELSWPSRLLILGIAAVVLPFSSRLVAQDASKEEAVDKPATATLDKETRKPDGDAENPKVDIPKAGIVEVEITIADRITKVRSIKGASSQLRKQARRIAQAETFSVVININGTTRKFTDASQAAAACNTLTRILDALKKSRIQLGDLGEIKPTPPPAFSQQTGARRARDGNDGLGAGGGLGGQSGSGSIQFLPGRGIGANGAGGQGGAGRRGGAGGQGGRPSKEQVIAMYRHAISQVMFDPNEAKRQRPKPASSESGSEGIARSGQATLFSRSAHRDYEKATFSFEFALRDDPNSTIGNDWDLQFGSVPNHFHVTMVSDDRSRIADLGEATLEQLDLAQLEKLPATARPQREFVPAIVGHVYVVHTVDRNTDLYAVFRVDEITQNRSCNISWKRIDAPGAADGQQ